MKKIIITCFIVALTISLNQTKIFSQEIKAEITVNVEQLEFEARNNVATMKRDLENYINNQKFTQNDWQGDPINVQMTIYLSGGLNNRYSAKLFIISTRPIEGEGDRKSVNLRMYEDKWAFEYALGANLTYNPLRFDAFTSVIDYYMLLIIGFDLDTWEELGGSSAFSEARKIVELGSSYNADGFSSYSNPGEMSKFNITSELTNLRFHELRKLIFAYYVDGLDLMESSKSEALKNLKSIFYNMALFKKNKLVESSVLLDLFFDSKAQEIASIFNGHKDTDVFDNLKYIDPRNSTLWDDSKSGKIGN
ncbi:DUF4835 family protein [Bacteroidetes/Chlorobi group bacterium ChocPot_Mid]|jgi:hypothetical protein|nr:MAG: DUF4835 family protein [Bacteroidetes/Chlorobi group bacterium ChocPot_Mid]